MGRDGDEVGVGVGKWMGWWGGGKAAVGRAGCGAGREEARERYRLGVVFGERVATTLHA